MKKSKMPYNIGNRGFSGKYPENTVLGFKKVIEEGYWQKYSKINKL